MRPELTGIGAVPHKAANDVEERSRSGLSPAVINSWAPMTGANALECQERGVGGGGAGKHPLLQLRGLLAELAVSSSQRPQRVQDVDLTGVFDHVGACSGEGDNEFRFRQVTVSVPQVGRSVDQQRLNLTPCRLLGFHRRSARNGQRPQRLDAGVLGVGGGLP